MISTKYILLKYGDRVCYLLEELARALLYNTPELKYRELRETSCFTRPDGFDFKITFNERFTTRTLGRCHVIWSEYKFDCWRCVIELNKGYLGLARLRQLRRGIFSSRELYITLIHELAHMVDFATKYSCVLKIWEFLVLQNDMNKKLFNEINQRLKRECRIYHDKEHRFYENKLNETYERIKNYSSIVDLMGLLEEELNNAREEIKKAMQGA